MCDPLTYAEVEKQRKRNIALPFTNCMGTSDKAHIGALWQTLAPFTLALKPVSKRFSLNRFSQTTSIMWFT